MKQILTAIAAIAILASPTFTQTPANAGPQRARLGSFAGQWTIEGDAEGEQYTIKDNCEWFAGGFHLVCRREGTGAGPMAGLRGQLTLGYSAGEKAYTVHTFNNFGNEFFMKGNVNDRTWTFAGDTKIPDGTLMKLRMTLTEQAPASYVFEIQGSANGTSWITFEKGKATKAH